MMEGMGKGDREAMGGRGRLPPGQTVGHWGRHPGKAEDSELRPPPPSPPRVGLGWRTHLYRGLGWGTHLHGGMSWGYPGLRRGVSHLYRGLGWGQGALRR